MKNKNDITIIGAGNVGLSLALALPDTFDIAIIDYQSPKIIIKEEYDLRVFAITRATENFLKQINAWDHIESARLSPYQKMRVWDSTGSGKIQFDSREVAESNLGHIIEQRVIHNALLKEINEKNNIKIIAPLELMQMEDRIDFIELRAESQIIEAKLVIGADGANSWCRKQAGITVKESAYGHSALVATVKTEKPHAMTARQVFMPTGPLAFLPLDDPHFCSIVWSSDPTHIKKLLALSDEDFLKQLAIASENCLGKVISTSQRVAFPLIKRHAEQYVRPRIALLGDAAHTVHPLAGQGINLGFADAKLLASVLRAPSTLGNFSVMRRYARERKANNEMMLKSMDCFKTLFANRNPLIKTLRNVGLQASDQLPFFKKALIRQAMGISMTV